MTCNSYATYVAVMIDVAVALVAIVLAMATPHQVPDDVLKPERAEQSPEAWAVYLTNGLSGMNALGAEVVWTRLVSLMLGGTVYTFSNILAVFLVGLGIGSSLGAMIGRQAKSPRIALGVCQMLLAGAIAWASLMISQSGHPIWPVSPDIA